MRARLCRFVLSGLIGGVLAMVAVSSAVAQTTYWELEPKKDPAAAIGTYTAVGGKTTPDGVSFTLKNNNIAMPLVMTLVSKTTGAKLHLSAFKDAEPFLDSDTDGDGRLTVKFRTGDNMRFRVTGPAGAEYQLSVWRGPEIKLPQPGPVVSMDSVIGKDALADRESPADSARQSSQLVGSDEESAKGSSSNTMIYILLGGILVVLGVIAFLIYRGQMPGQSRGKQE